MSKIWRWAELREHAYLLNQLWLHQIKMIWILFPIIRLTSLTMSYRSPPEKIQRRAISFVIPSECLMTNIKNLILILTIKQSTKYPDKFSYSGKSFIFVIYMAFNLNDSLQKASLTSILLTKKISYYRPKQWQITYHFWVGLLLMSKEPISTSLSSYTTFEEYFSSLI